MVGFKTKQCYNLIQSDPSVGEQLNSEMKSELATVSELKVGRGGKLRRNFGIFAFHL